MTPTLIRLKADWREVGDTPIDAVGDTALNFWKAGALRIEAGFFDRTTPLDLATVESITLRIRGSQTGGSHLMENTIAAADLNLTLTAEQWAAGTHQHAVFTFTASDTNIDVLDNRTSKELWLVLSALQTNGQRIILGAGPIVLYDPNFVVADDIDPPDPSDPNLSTGEADARYLRKDADQTLTEEERAQLLENLQLTEGTDGASAYEVAVANGFEGDEAAWLASLVGSDGSIGYNGWTPQLALVNDGDRRVAQLAGWLGGSGDAPGHVGEYIGADGFVSSIGAAVDLRGPAGSGSSGADGSNGSNGSNGWSPQFAVVSDGERRVLQLTGWTGGSGDNPGHVNEYVGASGFTSDISAALDLRGTSGGAGNNGDAGLNGWSPRLAVYEDGERRVLKLIEWLGGSGSTPGYEGQYLTASGFTGEAAVAVNIRGSTGPEATPITNITYDGNNLTIVTGGGSYGPFAIGGAPGAQGIQGAPGEVTNADLTAAIAGEAAARDAAIAANSSNISNSVTLLSMTVSDPPTQGEVQAIADKLDALITALRR